MPVDHLRHFAETIGDRTAVIDDRPGAAGVRSRSFAELDADANRVANGLLALGLTPGRHAAWWGANSLEVMTAIHAMRKAALVSVPIPYRSTASEAEYLLGHADVAALVIEAEHLDVARAARRALGRPLPFLVYGGDAELEPGDTFLDDVADDPREPVIPDRSDVTRTMIYTSGTTGRPKGAIRRVGGEANQFGALLELFGWPDMTLVFLTTGPLYHSGPSGFALRAHLVGGTVVTQHHFDPEDWLRLVETHRVSATFSAPTPIRRIVQLPAEVKARYDVSSMRTMIANAAPWTMSLKEAYLRDFPPDSLWEIYGSTELSVCTVLEPQDQLRKPGSCGRPAPGVELALFADDGTRIDEPDVPGELFVRSAGLFETYHKVSELDVRDGFHTVGDIASFDAEGYYRIHDRRSDLIISGGVNVYPAELENVLDAHPGVREVAVFGVPHPEWGHQVCAAVVLDAGTTVDDVERFAREHLSGAKVPRRIVALQELPKTGTGKVLKRDLRQLPAFGDQTSPPPGDV